MDVFHTLNDLKPFVFRITDNGGETADRYTIATCDGSYLSMSNNPYSPQGVCLTGDGLDPLRMDERVEAGVERDIRWVDLPKDCQRSFFEGLNESYTEWLKSFKVPTSKDDVKDISHLDGYDKIGEGIYQDGDAFYVLDEDPQGPFSTLREAFLCTLPEVDDLSGPEYHSKIDFWEEGSPEEPWDRQVDPPVLEEDSPYASTVLIGKRLPDRLVYGEMGRRRIHREQAR